MQSKQFIHDTLPNIRLRKPELHWNISTIQVLEEQSLHSPLKRSSNCIEPKYNDGCWFYIL